MLISIEDLCTAALHLFVWTIILRVSMIHLQLVLYIIQCFKSLSDKPTWMYLINACSFSNQMFWKMLLFWVFPQDRLKRGSYFPVTAVQRFDAAVSNFPLCNVLSFYSIKVASICFWFPKWSYPYIQKLFYLELILYVGYSWCSYFSHL